jgi:hypothetical protein
MTPYTESKETDPAKLAAGDLVQVPWGFSRLESVELTDKHYTLVLVPDVHGVTHRIERARGNWPFVSTGRRVRKGQARILTDGTRF